MSCAERVILRQISKGAPHLLRDKYQLVVLTRAGRRRWVAARPLCYIEKHARSLLLGILLDMMLLLARTMSHATAHTTRPCTGKERKATPSWLMS